jgi:Peptidase M50B-like
MQAAHEFGHAFGAWLTGGRVARVVLYPLTISRTDVSPNPHPLAVAWAGPVVGALLPVGLWLAAATARAPGAFLLRFFAGFCLVANGLYIGVGSFDGVGDCGEMLRHGAAPWHLWLFGAVTAPVGLWLWHRQGPHFGLWPARGNVSRGAAYAAAAACAGLVVLGFAVGGE